MQCSGLWIWMWTEHSFIHSHSHSHSHAVPCGAGRHVTRRPAGSRGHVIVLDGMDTALPDINREHKIAQ